MSNDGMGFNLKVESGEVEALIQRGMKMQGLRAGMAAAGVHVLSKLATYPPAPPQSTYRRTGTLGRRWVMRGTRNGFTVEIGNNTPYAPRVQGDEQLPRFREIGWKTPASVLQAEGGAILNIISAHVKRDL